MYGLFMSAHWRDARATLARRRTTRVVGVGVGVDGAKLIPSSSSSRRASVAEVARARPTARRRARARRRLSHRASANAAEDDVDALGFSKLDWARVRTPARYLGNEVGAFRAPWDARDGVEARFCVAYPETYEVGASNLGHVVLYTVLNQTPGTMCDRAYLPADDMIELMRARDARRAAGCGRGCGWR